MTDPTIAMATTMMIPIAYDVYQSLPATKMPATDAMTVKPETSTARPDVAAAACSAASAVRPAARSSRSRRR